MFLQHWGATPDEIHGEVVGDDLVPDARLVATRAITLAAPPGSVFPWLRQMGFGRAGWYSYDLLDNLGRRSADRVHPEWQQVRAGDPVPAGPVDFEAVVVDEPGAFVIRVRPPSRIGFSLAYDLRPVTGGTRLVTRVRARVDVPGGRAVERLVLGPGDGVMVRRQLLHLAGRLGRVVA